MNWAWQKFYNHEAWSGMQEYYRPVSVALKRNLLLQYSITITSTLIHLKWKQTLTLLIILLNRVIIYFIDCVKGHVYYKHGCISGRMFACHANAPGSILGLRTHFFLSFYTIYLDHLLFIIDIFVSRSNFDLGNEITLIFILKIQLM